MALTNFFSAFIIPIRRCPSTDSPIRSYGHLQATVQLPCSFSKNLCLYRILYDLKIVMTFIVQSENIRFHERIRSKNVIDSVVARKSRQRKEIVREPRRFKKSFRLKTLSYSQETTAVRRTFATNTYKV